MCRSVNTWRCWRVVCQVDNLIVVAGGAGLLGSGDVDASFVLTFAHTLRYKQFGVEQTQAAFVRCSEVEQSSCLYDEASTALSSRRQATS